ncbi:FAD binding domain-containing protein [Emericellopsis atlantica]|uniref:FAD binding domain-containing protein n=1 Tax=Emericellopsis atlantica TaxID=2614577 RepID=A0A9P7ZR66_9HYPO|nr:FAD binding domain-containing protein [Emericellopsis atlantica]KAG9256601.1 FAD binding domain-containing protein [Emericellopsis atlantica]
MHMLTAQCRALSNAGLSEVLYYPEDDEYASTLSSYYSADVQDIKPRCVLQPHSTAQVSTALKALSEEDGKCWLVGIRSGGHSPFPSNNVKQGVTIDLGALDEVHYAPGPNGTAEDGTVVVGSGARWGEVYAKLEPQGAMTTGGREGHVGVGGFLLGGGFSWYSGKLGMSADNVVSYEVVLADGTVVTADASENADLFKALKGGMNNIGVVTHFKLKTFASHNLFGGVMAFPIAQAPAIADRFVGMVDNSHVNPAETGFVSYSWTPATGSSVAFITVNTNDVKNSSSFQGLEDLGPLVDLRMSQPVSGIALQLQGTLGLYNIWFTLTFQNTVDMGRKFLEVFNSLIADIQGDIDESVNIIFVMTPLPTTYKKGGDNILGLNENLTKNSIVVQFEALMPSDKYKTFLTSKLRDATAGVQAYAEKTGQDNKWLYVNYANREQDALGTYGEENLDFLERVAKKYDPEGFFQDRVTGGFKITRRS